MIIRKVDNKYLPEQIVEYLNRDIEDQEYAESLGINHEVCYLELLLREQENAEEGN